MGKIISGLLKKSIAGQDIMNHPCVFDMDIIVSNNSGTFACDLYNEADDPSMGFFVYDGKLVDYASNRFIYGIIPNESFNIKMSLSGQYTNYFINGEYLLSTDQVVMERQSLSAITFFTQNCVVDVDLRISGKLPEYSFSGFSFNGSGNSGIGYVVNQQNALPFRVYSGISSSGEISFVTNSGDITGVGSFNLIRNYELTSTNQLSDNTTEFDFQIYGNFGVTNKRIPVSTVFPTTQEIESYNLISFTGIDSGTASLNWSNYKGETVSNAEIPGRLRITATSGLPVGSGLNSYFSGFFSDIDGNSFSPMTYSPSISGYEYSFVTQGLSGIQYRLMRYLTGPSIALNINYSGHNTGLNYMITGF